MATLGHIYPLLSDKPFTQELARKAYDLTGDVKDMAIVLFVPCHPSGVFRAAYIPSDGAISLKCAECGKIVGSFKVAEK